MIVPMKKVSLVVMEKYREASLERLRELGVLHLESHNGVSETLSKLLEQKGRIEAALGILRNYEAIAAAPVAPASATHKRRKTDIADGDDSYNAEAVVTDGFPQDPADRALALVDDRKSIQEQLAQDIKELNRVEKWGDFSPADFEALKEAGVTLIPYELTRKSYESLGESSPVLVLSKGKTLVYCLAFGGALPGEIPFALPARSVTDIKRGIKEKQWTLGNIEKQLTALVAETGAIKKKQTETLEAIEFESARVNMQSIDDEEVPGALAVTYLTGFVPADLAGVVKRGAVENGWALMIDEPEDTDNPPTLLKNNPFARIIKPLFDFLGTLPGYREYDISFSYLLFFALFFAMIFGDAAYGSLLFVIAIILGISNKKKSGKVPDAVWLLTLLSGCTIAWGTINGAWFAMPQDKLPHFLRALVIPPFDSALNSAKQVQANVQFLCFSIGIVHLAYAHIKNIRKALPSLVAVAQFGWLCMMAGLYFLVLFMLLGEAVTLPFIGKVVPLPPFVVPLIGGGLGLYFIFVKQTGGNFFANIGKGLADFLSTFLSAVSSFADIISYIRLFAVGLAGAAIAESFNNMGLGIPGLALRFTAGVLILIFGHGLNMMMNVLSVVVHGVRLNLLEYAGHLGLEWSGYSYAPFARKAKEQDKK
ncbi:V-type ATP synthase subunit I [Spirochaetia bacterium]|nr:V-type ATP synthase subunit I [Spirochaetia bacterium]